LKELLRTLNDAVGTSLAAIHREARPGDVRHSCADISKAARLLGYRPLVSFEDGLRLTLEWYRSSSPAGLR
jgi:nucleoside-diphosphate-sugar epimerase